MKKLLFILILLPIIANAQYTQPIKVEIVPKSSYSNPKIITAQPQPNPYDMSGTINKMWQNNAAGRSANAANRSATAAEASARSEALKNNSEKIEIDLLKGYSNKYKYLAIKRVSGWATSGNFVSITNEINRAKRYQIVSLNSLGMYVPSVNSASATSNDRKSKKIIKQIDKNQFYEPIIPQQYLNDSETLFLEWSREALTPVDRLSRLTLKNSSGETLYQAEYKNKGYSEMLRPLLSDYTFGKEDAKNKLIELKEYLDLGIITQDEFDEKARPLKKILIGN